MKYYYIELYILYLLYYTYYIIKLAEREDILYLEIQEINS
jgi:hypothetical protein